MEEVTCLCTVTFHWSTVGKRLLKGRAREKTPSGTSGRPLTPRQVVSVPPGFVIGLGASPFALRQLFASLLSGTNEVGPALRLKTGLPVSAFICWAPSTGKFCVIAWPKIEPNTPISKLRPYPRRTTVLGFT